MFDWYVAINTHTRENNESLAVIGICGKNFYREFLIPLHGIFIDGNTTVWSMIKYELKLNCGLYDASCVRFLVVFAFWIKLSKCNYCVVSKESLILRKCYLFIMATLNSDSFFLNQHTQVISYSNLEYKQQVPMKTVMK